MELPPPYNEAGAFAGGSWLERVTVTAARDYKIGTVSRADADLFCHVALEEVFRTFAMSGEITPRGGLARRLAIVTTCVAPVLVACANVDHYVDWQSRPHTRLERYLYVITREFPRWSAPSEARATHGIGITNVEEWRTSYPVRDWADPFGESR